VKKQHKIWLEKFLDNCRQMNRSEHTIKNYQLDLEKFIFWFEATHGKALHKAGAEAITEYNHFLKNGGEIKKKTRRREKLKYFFQKMLFRPRVYLPLNANSGHARPPLAVTSRRRHLSAIKNFFEFLKQTHEDQQKIFLTNPVKSKIHSVKLKDTDYQATKLLTPEDWENILNYVHKPMDKLLVHLLYFGGLRLSELAQLKWEDYDTRNDVLTLRRKGGYIHHLKIQNEREIKYLLNMHYNTQKHPSDYLFSNKKGAPYGNKTLYNRIMKIFLRSGCERGLGPHSFRKACATNLYIKTKDLLQVRDYLNHSDAKVTQSYISL
jgi:integrase/recombinase XerD